MPARPWKAWATAPPVSPEVAVRIVKWGRGPIAECGHRAGHESRADVLECMSGAVEELEHVDAGLDLAQGDRKVEGAVDDRRGGHRPVSSPAQEMARGDHEGPPGESEVQARAARSCVRQTRDERCRDEEPAVRSLAEEEGLAGRSTPYFRRGLPRVLISMHRHGKCRVPGISSVIPAPRHARKLANLSEGTTTSGDFDPQ